MTHRSEWLLLCFSLLTPAVVPAQEPGQEPLPPTPGDVVLSLIPADTAIAAFTSDFAAVLGNPALRAAAEADMQAPANEAAKLLDGPAMISISGVPILPPTWRFTIAAKLADSAGDPLDAVGRQLVPLLQAVLGSADGSVAFSRAGERGQITFGGLLTMTVTVAVRDGLLFGSSDAFAVDAWLSDQLQSESFVQGEEFARLTADRPLNLTSLVYVNLRPVMPLAGMQINQHAPRMFEASQLDRIESFALITGTQPTAPAAPDLKAAKGRKSGASEQATEKPAEIVRLAVAARLDSPGPLRFIASQPGKTTLAALFPAGTEFYIGGSMNRGSAVLEDLFAFFGAIDRLIVDEYEEERERFKKEIGVDLQGELAAAFQGEWALGGRMSSEARMEEAVFALKIANVELFRSLFQRLQDAFEMKATPNTYRGEVIYTAHRKPHPFSYAFVGDALLLSSEPQFLSSAIDAHLDARSLATTRRFQDVRRAAPERCSKFVYLDASMMAYRLMERTASKNPGLAEFARAQTGLGLGITATEGLITLDLAAGTSLSRPLLGVLGQVMGEPIEDSRRQAVRTVSMSRMKEVLVACHMHANDHKNEWPDSLNALVAGNHLGPPDAAVELLSTPYSKSPTGRDGYVYRKPQNSKDNKRAAETPVLGEPEVRDGGACIGFMDGHVEWVESPKAEAFIATLRGR